MPIIPKISNTRKTLFEFYSWANCWRRLFWFSQL